ncbi:MAG: prolipoprotein diacylglyceryl transferase [Bacteroidetes bacterium]|nr:prolipoprotein diacylglyceryl transferase [Fibrella sp.]
MLQYVTWDVDPEIFHIGAFSVRWYGLMFAMGFVIGIQIMTHIFKVEKKPLSDADPLLLTMVVSIVLGARIGHFLFYEPEMFLRNPLDILLPPYAGLASHGAALGVLIGLWLYSRRRSSIESGQTFFWTIDRLMITAALGGAFIRFGNLMNSEIVGRPTDVPWAFIFMRNDEYEKIPRHPAQLYESISCLIVTFILAWWWNHYKEKTPRGSMVGIFLIWLFGLRFFFEYLKEVQVAKELTMSLNIGQQLSIPAVALGIFFLVRSFRNRDKDFAANPVTLPEKEQR